MFNHISLWESGKEHQSERLKEREIDRLLKRARADSPRLYDRLLHRIGGFFIFSGLRLKKHYQPVPQPQVCEQCIE